MYINGLQLVVKYLKGAPFYWGGLKIPYRELQTNQYPFLSSVICGILYVFPIYLRNAVIQARYREYGIVDHVFPVIYTVFTGFVIFAVINCLMICVYWLIVNDKNDPKYRWIRAHRIFAMSAFYQFILFLVLAILGCWQILRGTGISGYHLSKVILLYFTCMKLWAVFAAIRTEILFGNQRTSLTETEHDASNLNDKLSNSQYFSRCILGALLSLDVILIWVTI